ncbi:copper homeostasis protein CutC [Winogradskyella alexanderae]|uniref:PF03932 family protein CutC n=1 Tax=Winogradskyella alexanderae TaxID=2877123 RepID=A0ABS7XMK5_9FLAO|nr:copper homeostasis protein CutC [Winogradskyella alexanderae]MCA0130995.1 copper homeostasis protein CutC [Winogradskyella alexanderae]
MLLEICANSFQSAKNAQEAGAHRIELCQELSVGGLTPSYGLLRLVKEKLHIPIHILIRPRSGNFIYTAEEFEQMQKDIALCRELNFDGIVSGILKKDKTIDIERTKALIDLARPLSFTFHRAFDEVMNPLIALKQLIELGVERVLTSGQKSSAEQGIELLKHLKTQSKGEIIIMPGSGINASNLNVFKANAFSEIHSSASSKVSQSESLFSEDQTVSDINKIRTILHAI